MRATVLVRPRPGILDPQGQAVESSLRHLGFDVDSARVGRLVDVDLPTEDRVAALDALGRMCEQLLTNPLIESYAIELDGVPVEDGLVAATTTHTAPNAT